VDGHLVELAGRDEDVPGERADRTVPGGLHADGQPVRGGEPYGRHDVLRASRLHHGGRPHRHREVPRRDERVSTGALG